MPDEIATQSTLDEDSFLELESMASMRRLGDSGTHAFFEGGSTLINLDGEPERMARDDADAHRSQLAKGHHVSERYRVVGEIARGGMGAVLDVQDNDLDRHVAMKVLLRGTRDPADTSLDTGPVNRFIAEAQLTGWLEHPNIVPVHELGLDAQGRVYFTMKRVKGRSLRQIMDKLRQGDPATLAEFTLARLLTILLKVFDAMDFAHSRGVVHRDLKPENIMVGEFGEVLVMDWGLAKQVGDAAAEDERPQIDTPLGAADGDGDSSRTREGTISGTPAYMAPEQALGAVDEISARTDIFCLGAILYEILCMVPPYLSASMSDALQQAREHRLRAPRQKLESVLKDKRLRRAFGEAGIQRGRKPPRELVSIAMRAMSRRREMRYHSAGDLKREVENYINALPVSAHRDNPFVALNKWARRNPAPAATLTLALIFMLLGGVVFAAVRAKASSDRAELAEQTRASESAKLEEIGRRLDAEAEAREQAERAATLEQQAAERERREAEKMAARQAAFVPYNKGSDLRTRSATFSNWEKRAEIWRQSAVHFERALQLDPTFVEAHVQIAAVFADLGFDDDALYHFNRADALTASETGRGHVEALMSYAMYDFQRNVLREGLSGNFEEVFRRFEPVREAADPGSYYARIAQILLDLGRSYRSEERSEFVDARDRAMASLAEIEREGTPLWEVYTLLALFDMGSPGARDYLSEARELKPNLPLLVWLEMHQAASRVAQQERMGLRNWDRFIDRFPYDPRGYFSRANLRFHSAGEHDVKSEVADLNKAVELNPRYADAHKLLLRTHVRDGAFHTAMSHLDHMRRVRSGLENSAIDLIEAELTAGTGEFDRLTNLVISSLQENPAYGVETLATGVSVLLRDHEYESLVDLCLTVEERFREATPPIVPLFLGRALTMLGRFDEAVEVLRPLEANPGLLPREWRGALRGWAEDARLYPASWHDPGRSMSPRRRFDIARALASSGKDPEVWVPRFNTQGLDAQQVVTWVYPADYILRARGYAMLSDKYDGVTSRALRALAVLDLKQAIDEGYLNRRRILGDEYLAPLVGEPELEDYFDVQ